MYDLKYFPQLMAILLSIKFITCEVDANLGIIKFRVMICNLLI